MPFEPSTPSLASDHRPPSISVRCWGVRGNFPSLEKNQDQYGSHTTCIEVCLGQQRLIFDAGSGLCVLGQWLNAQPVANSPLEAHLFLSCTHWDRIQGFPFFLPAFQAHHQFHVYGPVAITGASIKHQLMDQMRRPYCAVSLRDMKSELRFHDIMPSQRLVIPAGAGEAMDPDLEVEVFNLSSVEPVLGYRIRWHDWTVAYATAVEIPRDAAAWGPLLQLAEGVDLLIYGTADSQDDWRRSRHPLGEAFDLGAMDLDWQAGLALAQKAQVDQLMVVRHRPFCSDHWLQQCEQAMRQQFPRSYLAREGMTVVLPDNLLSDNA